MTKPKHCLPLVLCGLWLCVVAPAMVARPTKSGTTKSPAVKKPASLVVQGKIRAIARTPRPGSVPYKDAVVALHLTDVKPIQGKTTQKSIVVYIWGMRNNKLTPAASYKTNQTIKLKLQPWEKVESKHGRYQRIELDDDAVLTLDAFWGELTK